MALEVMELSGFGLRFWGMHLNPPAFFGQNFNGWILGKGIVEGMQSLAHLGLQVIHKGLAAQGKLEFFIIEGALLAKISRNILSRITISICPNYPDFSPLELFT